MKKECDKAIRRAYRKGREDGFDHGVNVTKMIYSEMTAELIRKHQREIEQLNSELILGEEEEEDDGGDAEDTTFYSNA